MAISDYAQQTREITRYGVDYEVNQFEAGVKCITPIGEPTLPDDDLALGLIDDMQRFGCVEIDTPGRYGYATVNTYHPNWPKSGSSHIFRHDSRQEFLKIPVLVKRGALQFFAMNGIAKALDGHPELRIVHSRVLFTRATTRSSAALIEEAPGEQARSVFIKLDRNVSSEAANDFSQQLAARLKLLLQDCPLWLRPFMNDNPQSYPAFGNGYGLQNTFLVGPEDSSGAINPSTAEIFLIDQANPTIKLLAYHMLARYFSASDSYQALDIGV